MKTTIFLALSLLASASLLSLPSKDSVIYHGTQFTAGVVTGVAIEKIIENCGLRYGTRGYALLQVAKYATVLKAPDILDQRVLKQYAAQQSKDMGRWAYFLGTFLNFHVRTLFTK